MMVSVVRPTCSLTDGMSGMMVSVVCPTRRLRIPFLAESNDYIKGYSRNLGMSFVSASSYFRQGCRAFRVSFSLLVLISSSPR